MLDFKRGTAVLLLAVCLVTGIEANTPNGRMAIADPQRSLLQKAQLIGPVKPNTKLQLFVQLKLRNQEGLDQLLKELYDAHSPKYQHFLTSDEFKAQYAPGMNALNAVKDYFTSMGMQAQILGTAVQVSGTAKQVEQAMGVQLNNYHYQQRTVYANATTPTLPAAIAPYVSLILGLNNLVVAHPASHKRAPQTFKNGAHLGNKKKPLSESRRSFSSPTNDSLNGLTGAQMRVAYNVAGISAVNGTTIDGIGQIIAITDGCDPTYSNAQIISDANEFGAANGLPPIQLTIVNVGGWTTCPGNTGEWAEEISIDVQSVYTMAPNAQIILYLADDDNDLEIALTAAVTDNTSSVISNSWGLGSEPTSLPGPWDATLQQAAAQGQSVNFSSGDGTGSASGFGYPEDTPYVTSVGGSSLFIGSNGSYSFESGWPQTTGGISAIYPAQIAQANAIGTFTAGSNGVINTHICQGQICRAIPDIAMDADQNTGLLIYNDLYCGFGASPCPGGGTSQACPLFSGTLALVNQVKQLNGLSSRLGLAAPYLYANNLTFLQTHSLNVITPPHMFEPDWSIYAFYGPYSFNVPEPEHPLAEPISFNYFDTAAGQAMEENQFWNDVVGVGSPNASNFVSTFATL